MTEKQLHKWYKDWCKRTERNGGVLVGRSVREMLSDLAIELSKNYKMTQQEMFEKSFERPSNFFKLSAQEQWDIDKKLGILDWEGGNLTDEEKKRFYDHYDSLPKQQRNDDAIWIENQVNKDNNKT